MQRVESVMFELHGQFRSARVETVSVADGEVQRAQVFYIGDGGGRGLARQTAVISAMKCGGSILDYYRKKATRSATVINKVRGQI